MALYFYTLLATIQLLAKRRQNGMKTKYQLPIQVLFGCGISGVFFLLYSAKKWEVPSWPTYQPTMSLFSPSILNIPTYPK